MPTGDSGSPSEASLPFGMNRFFFPLGIAQRLMQMPAAGAEARDRRPRHEACEIAHAARDLTRGAAEQDQIVGGGQRIPRRKGAFDLARSPFVFDRAQRQVDRLEMLAQRRQHRLHDVEVGFGVIRIAGLDREGADRLALDADRVGVFRRNRIAGERAADTTPLRARPSARISAASAARAASSEAAAARSGTECRC